MSIDLALDPDTHDLYIAGNDINLVKNADELEQNLKIRLQFFLNEWFLNILVGVPFYADILVKNPNISNIDSILKGKILDTPGVNEILEYDSTFDNTARTYSVTFKIRTQYGESDLTVSLFGDS